MNRSEVWQMSLDSPAADQTTEGATRLVVILSSDALAVLPLRIIVPLTPWKEDFSSAPWIVRVPPVLNSGLEQVMAADALQVRSVSTARLRRKVGDLPQRLTGEIVEAVAGIIQP